MFYILESRLCPLPWTRMYKGPRVLYLLGDGHINEYEYEKQNIKHSLS